MGGERRRKRFVITVTAIVLTLLVLVRNKTSFRYILALLTEPSSEWNVEFDSRNFLMAPRNICSGEHIKLVVCVTTSPENSIRRQAIRKTWGSVASKTGQIRLVFVVGRPIDPNHQRNLEREQNAYCDILQGDFVDTYRNLTLKSMTTISWSADNCKSADYILKTDDDMFINVPNLKIILKIHEKRKDLLLGYVYSKAHPDRNTTSRWYVPESEFQMRNFPVYISGAAYVMSLSTVKKINAACAKDRIFLSMEDVYVTGVCAKRAGIKHCHNSNFAYYKLSSIGGCTFGRKICGHGVTPPQMRKIWSEMSNSILMNMCPNSTTVKRNKIHC